ncbi:MAG: O-antigen ligase family protein [Synergistaceae bacterium]|jgi:O-antigen ligase|nr:O-antigen ligase family protein [Synergistaceae bacterium]
MESDYDAKAEKFKGANLKMARLKKRLAPVWLTATALFITFSLPNLVFSGRYWFDTLHIMKWTVTMVPIGILTIAAGISLIRFGAERTNFKLDAFGALWLMLLTFITVQPFLLQLSSGSTFAKEWFYFASLFGVYMLTYNLCDGGKLHRALLWGGSVNASINILFAELLIRNMNGRFPFILDVPGNYIGNTAQQEMFGLWTAMAVLNCIFLHLHYVGELKEREKLFDRPALFSQVALNLFFLTVNSWGLWSSTARGAILSLLVAFVVLVVGLWRSGRISALKRSAKLFGIVAAFLAIFLAVSSMVGTGRGNAFVAKMMDMMQNPTSVGGRISIWRTSLEVFLKAPITGVGLGHYKWSFLDAQRIMYKKRPDLLDAPGYEWQFTYWAHSEYIQWLCETGIIGSALLLLLAVWWLYSFILALVRRDPLPQAALWGCAMLFLLWFDALFSRPFHRIENSVWMALAFAMSNRSILRANIKWTIIESSAVYRIFGVFLAAVSIYGLFFLAGGIRGDQLIYGAMSRAISPQESESLLKSAETYVMSRDDAKEQFAYLYARVGAAGENVEIFTEGLRYMYAAFLRRPTSALLFDLITYGRKLGASELISLLEPYLKPGMLNPDPQAP